MGMVCADLWVCSRGKLNYIHDSCAKCAEDIKTLKKLNVDEKDAGTRSKQKVTCSKLEKDFAAFQQSANTLSRTWAAKEKKNIPIPPKANVFPYVLYWRYISHFLTIFVDPRTDFMRNLTRNNLYLVT